jgi:hypothetical protein
VGTAPDPFSFRPERVETEPEPLPALRPQPDGTLPDPQAAPPELIEVAAVVDAAQHAWDFLAPETRADSKRWLSPHLKGYDPIEDAAYAKRRVHYAYLAEHGQAGRRKAA